MSETYVPRVINTIGPVRLEPLPDGRFMIYVESTPEHDERQAKAEAEIANDVTHGILRTIRRLAPPIAANQPAASSATQEGDREAPSP